MGHLLRGWATATAWLAALWAVVFAGAHLLWASGSTLGLGDAGQVGLREWVPGHDVAVAVLCLAGAVLAAFLAHPPRDLRWEHRFRLVATVVGLLLLLRGVIGVGQLGWWLATDPSRLGIAAVWEFFLLEGGLLYLAAAGIGLNGRPAPPRAGGATSARPLAPTR